MPSCMPNRRDACRLRQFAAFDQDAIDNLAFLAKGKLTMPVLAVGGEKSFGPTMAAVMRVAASDVKKGWSRIPGIGSWKRTRRPPSSWFALSSTRVKFPEGPSGSAPAVSTL